MSAALTARIAEDFAAAQSQACAPAQERRRAASRRCRRPDCPARAMRTGGTRTCARSSGCGFVPVPPAAFAQLTSLPAPLTGFARYVFVDGRFAAELSAPAARSCRRRRDRPAGPPPRPLPEHGTDQRFALLNEAFATDGARIELPAGTPAQRLELLFVACAASAQRRLLPAPGSQLGAGAQLRADRTPRERRRRGELGRQCGRDRGSRAAHACTHYRLQELVCQHGVL